MKVLSTILICWILVSNACGQAIDKPKANSYLEFNEYIIDFDSIQEGEKISVPFYFENKSNKDISIRDVKTNCGCTSSYWPRSVLEPGAKDSIIVTFNSTNKPPGKENRRIEVFHSASDNPINISLQGFIISDKKLPVVPSLLSSDTITLKELHKKLEDFSEVDELTKLLAGMFDEKQPKGALKFEEMYIIDTISMDAFTVKLNTAKVFELMQAKK